LKLAGLPTDAKSKFQRIRRSHATHLHIAGGDATASLGHSSDSITRRHYLDVRLLSRQSAEKLLFRPGRRLRTLWRLARG
jgi:integrase